MHDRVKQLQDAMLTLPQADCPVKHLFMPGIYMREVTLPAGATCVGHHQKYNHINILVKGRVTVLSADGSLTELKAPLTFIGHPGKKCGYVHEEVIWINVHNIDCTDVETIEDILYDKSEAPQYAKQIAGDGTDYNQLLIELNTTDDQITQEMVVAEPGMLPMPYGIFKVKVSDSPIHGKGVFATSDIVAGEIIAPATQGGKRTPIARYTNHSDKPNAEMQSANGDYFLVALRDIKGCRGGMDGEELTTDYRNNRRLVCQE